MVGRGEWLRPVLSLEAVQQRFWGRVDKTDGCWLWTGTAHGYGYGLFNLPKTETAPARTWRAHRLSWVWEHGSIPDGLRVCHKCDVPACVRPDHLFLGTDNDNMRDAINKGRMWEGADHPLAKLTPDAVRDIRHRAANGEIPYRIALSIGINPGTVWGILNGLSWKAVEIEEPWW
jgi:hypothetical protein